MEMVCGRHSCQQGSCASSDDDCIRRIGAAALHKRLSGLGTGRHSRSTGDGGTLNDQHHHRRTGQGGREGSRPLGFGKLVKFGQMAFRGLNFSR